MDDKKDRETVNDRQQDIDIIGGKIPDLDNGKCTDNVRNKPAETYKTSVGDVKERIVPTDDKYEYQVIDKLKILYLFFGFDRLQHRDHLKNRSSDGGVF